LLHFCTIDASCIAGKRKLTGGILQCGDKIYGTTVNASSVNVDECGTNTGRGGARWYYFKEDDEQKVTISTCSNRTDYDTKLGVFHCDGTCVGGNDDAKSCSGNEHSTFTFYAEKSVTYNILVHGYINITGNYEISVECESLVVPDVAQLEIEPTPEQNNERATDYPSIQENEDTSMLLESENPEQDQEVDEDSDGAASISLPSSSKPSFSITGFMSISVSFAMIVILVPT